MGGHFVINRGRDRGKKSTFKVIYTGAKFSSLCLEEYRHGQGQALGPSRTWIDFLTIFCTHKFMTEYEKGGGKRQ